MAGNSKKPRKKHVPKRTGMPVVFRFNEEAEQRLQLAAHAELLKLRSGLADEPTWHTITCRINIGQTIAHQENHEGEVKNVMAAALAAMRSVFERYQSTGKWGTTGDELKAIGEGLVMTDELQKNSTRRTIKRALEHVYRVAAY